MRLGRKRITYYYSGSLLAFVAVVVATSGAIGVSASNKMAPWPPEGVSGAKATFAGGCFWGLELAMQRVPGVKATAAGYIAGTIDEPTYEAVCTGKTNHAEAVQVIYDESEVSFASLMDAFFAKHDPTTLNRQGGDVGTQYRSGIYAHSEQQLEEAKARVASVPNATTEVIMASTFWPAEEYHQQV